jgi:hypothetical protein
LNNFFHLITSRLLLTVTELDKLESVEKAEYAMYRDHRIRSGCALVAKNI